MPYARHHKEQTRRRIVGAAAQLFNRKGFEAVTIGEIMTQAGLTHGGFYRHFRGKDQLYAEAVRHFLRQEARPRWQKGPKDGRRPDQPLARLVLDAYLSRDHMEDIGGSRLQGPTERPRGARKRDGSGRALHWRHGGCKSAGR